MKFYRYPKFKVPEREPLRIARAQRLTTLVAHDPRFADLPNFANRLKALSPVPTKIDTALSQLKNVKGRAMSGPKAALIAAALSGFSEKDFGDPLKRTHYRMLRAMQLQSREYSRAGVGRQNVSPTGGDKRRYNPTGKSFASTVHGTVAKLTTPVHGMYQVFAHPGSVIPCVQRKIRKEVMFAKRKAGKGYRSPKRRTWASGVPC